MRTAVVYASMIGHTRAAAEYIAGKLGADVIDLKKDKRPDIGRYDRIIIGSGVYAGKMSKKVRKFVYKEAAELSSKDTHLFLTCMFDEGKADRQLDGIAESMPFLTSKAYFTNVEMNDPSANIALTEFAAALADH